MKLRLNCEWLEARENPAVFPSDPIPTPPPPPPPTQEQPPPPPAGPEIPPSTNPSW
jgi:hypothetical protein